MIQLRRELRGKILDIGGGGEGVIGQLYGEQVVAIDNRQEELDEAPGCFEKRLMDATCMTFEDGAFDNVTSFYTLMFMRGEEQRKALREAVRVTTPHGEIHIWDCNIACAYPEPFCIDVEVRLPGRTIRTTYGVGKLDAQSMDSIRALCEEAGLRVEKAETDGMHFYLKCRKR